MGGQSGNCHEARRIALPRICLILLVCGRQDVKFQNALAGVVQIDQAQFAEERGAMSIFRLEQVSATAQVRKSRVEFSILNQFEFGQLRQQLRNVLPPSSIINAAV